MRVIRSLKEMPADLAGGVMTIGNFDGVHLAHQAIIRQVIGEAREAGARAIVMTFEPHPQQVLHPERKPFYLITTLEEKLQVLEALGVDVAVVVPFTSEFSHTTAAEFAQRIICDTVHPVNVMIGHDYTFGHGKEGKPEYLRALGKTCGFGVEVIGAVEMDGGIVSSTRVRNAIQAGDVSLAAKLLGRPYSLGGHVVEGDRRGRDIGFPTANIVPEKLLIPLRGVYAAFVNMNGERFRAAVNIGYNPTFTDLEKLSIEAHLLDFKGHLYGRKLILSFIERIRDEQKFNSLEALVARIAKDVEQTKNILNKL